MQLAGSRNLSPRVSRTAGTLSTAFWLALLAFVALFTFLAAMGAFDPLQTAGITVAVAAAAVLWLAHAVWASRQAHGRDAEATRARERRGF